eukprot:m.88810 g.88810  ORF g.88810 m.88810 type:complete len:1118 (-) comp12868_c0_seq2:3539-6892(-)
MEQRLAFLVNRATEIFTTADIHSRGWLSKSDLKKLIHKDDELREELRTAGGRTWKDFWAELDANGDGQIGLDELVDYITKVQVEKANAVTGSLTDMSRVVYATVEGASSNSVDKSALRAALEANEDIKAYLKEVEGEDSDLFWSQLDASKGPITEAELIVYIAGIRDKSIQQAVANVQESTASTNATQDDEQLESDIAAAEAEVAGDSQGAGAPCASCEALEARIAELMRQNALLEAQKGSSPAAAGGSSSAATAITDSDGSVNLHFTSLHEMQHQLELYMQRAALIYSQHTDAGSGLTKEQVLSKVLPSDVVFGREFQTQNQQELEAKWAELDLVKDGEVDLQELMTYLTAQLVDKANQDTEHIKARAAIIFVLADKDKNGWLSKTELKRLLQLDPSIRHELRTDQGRQWKSFWAELDANGDGRIQLDELIEYIATSRKEAIQQAVAAARLAAASSSTTPEGSCARCGELEAQLDAANSANDALKGEVTSLTTRVEALMLELEKVKAQAETDKQSAVDELNASLKKAELRAEYSENMSKTQGDRIKDLEAKLDAKHSQLDKLDKDHQAELDILQEHVNSLEALHQTDEDSLSKQHIEHNRAMTELRRQVGAATTAREEMEVKVAESDKALQDSKAEVERLQAQLDAKHSQLEKLDKDHQAELDLLQQQLNGLEAVHQKDEDSLAKEAGDHQRELAALRRELSSVTGEKEEVEDRLAKSEEALSRCAEAAAQLSASSKQVDELQQQLATTKVEYATVASQVDELQGAISQRDAELTALRQQAAASGSSQDAQTAELQKQLAELQATKLQLEAESVQLQDKCAARETQVSGLEAQIAELTSKCNALTEELNTLKASSDASGQQDQARLTELIDELSSTKQQLEEAKLAAARAQEPGADNSAFDALTAELRERIAALESELAALREEHAACQQTVEELAAAKQALAAGGNDKDTIADLQKQLQMAELRRASLEDVLTDLRETQKSASATPAATPVAAREKPVSPNPTPTKKKPASVLPKPTGPRPAKTDKLHRHVSKSLLDAGLDPQALTYHAPGKYSIVGEDKILNVRQTGSNLMVRVGGGWETLGAYLKNHHHRINDSVVRWSKKHHEDINAFKATC